MTSIETQFIQEGKQLDDFRDDLESEDFVGKVSKFEFLSHNSSPSPTSADKQRWAVIEGFRFPTKSEQTTSPKNVTSKPPPFPSTPKLKQGPPTLPKPISAQNSPASPDKDVHVIKYSISSPSTPSIESQTIEIEQTPSPKSFAVMTDVQNGNVKKIEIAHSHPNNLPRHSSQEDLANCENELAAHHKMMKEERLKDQELEQQEQLRLQEILSMCADFERQLLVEKQQIIQQSSKPQHTGIKTNGSLPRDTPPISASSLESMSPSPDNTGRGFFKSTSSENDVPNNQSSIVCSDQNLSGCSKESDINDNVNDKIVQVSRIDPLVMSTRPGIRTVANLNDSSHYNKNESKTGLNSPLCSPKVSSFSMDSSNDRICLSLKRNQEMQELNKKDQLKKLKALKCETETVINDLRRQIKDLENQESEILFEYEMEKALLEGEKKTQISDLLDDEKRFEAIHVQEQELNSDSFKNQRVKNEDLIEDSKIQLECMKKNINETNKKLSESQNDTLDSEEEERLRNYLIRTQENLEAEKKIFEDLEFQKLELETHCEEERETLQHRLDIEKDIISERIKLKKIQLEEIEMQLSSITELVRSDTVDLESKRQILLNSFRKEKLKYVGVLKRITEIVEEHKVEQSDDSSGNRSSDDEGNMDYDENLNQKLAELNINNFSQNQSVYTSDDVLISKVAHHSSLSPTDQNVRTSKTLKEVERNRQSILDKQGPLVLEEERERVNRLKKRVSDEVRSQWEENRRQQREINCSSIHSTESDEACSLTSSEMPTDTPSSGDDVTTASTSSIVITTPEIHNFNDFKDMLNSSSDLNGFQNDEKSSNEHSSDVVKRRETLRSQRPLTRYLPIRQNDFNLRLHIESAGHQLDICKYSVVINAYSCRGYLHKLSRKFKSWKKRWFVFDRNRRALMYFRDKSEAKARRVIYFQDIEEVYVDHQHKVKGPHPRTTFCIKTVDRLFFMMAPSPEAMRIWVDVIFTGAEGYQEFMLDMDL